MVSSIPDLPYTFIILKNYLSTIDIDYSLNIDVS